MYVHTKAPKPSLYLELGCIPINYIIKSRRLLFLQYILKLKKDDTISKVFWAQKENPIKNDWFSQVEEDIKEFQLDHFSLDQIGKMSKYLFKKFVKTACKKKAFEDLLKEKEKLSKMENNNYCTFQMQKYFTSSNISLRQKKLIFKLRSKMAKVGYNYGQKISCPLCKLHEDNQDNLLECIILKMRCKELYMLKDEKYDDIFSSNLNKLGNISKIYQRCFEIREEILAEAKHVNNNNF